MTHGLFTKTIVSPEDREAFDRHYQALCTDPTASLLASAALIYAHVERVKRRCDEDGFFKLEKVDSDDRLTVKTVEVTGPMTEVLRKAALIVLTAHEVEKARRDAEREPPAVGITVNIPKLSDIAYDPEPK